MKTIGGEAELAKEEYNIYYTDSGRSSLRLILRSLKGKIIALPNYLCSTITEVLEDENIEYIYYNVSGDFKVDLLSLGVNFDVLYVIDYFGITHDYLSGNKMLNDKIVIEDNVFSPFIENTCIFNKWISFNSYRKFSFCAEGSMIKSTLKLNQNEIITTFAPFIEEKYKAKELKFNYINNQMHSEEEYLDLFKSSEQILDNQQDIFFPSDLGIANIIKFNQDLFKEMVQRELNYETLKNKINSPLYQFIRFKSFFVFSCENRNELRKHLFQDNIFLPIHWPNTLNINNPLYNNLLSVPVDSRYNAVNMNFIATIINKYAK